VNVSRPSATRAVEKVTPPNTLSRTYIYAIIGDMQSRTYGNSGINGRKVYSIPAGRVAAVVSDLPGEKIRPERAHLAAHQGVLKRLLAESTPLPTSFGMVADSSQAVHDMLTRNQHELVEQLRRVAGKVEMGLRVAWDVPNIFEYFVNTHAELKLARDQLLGGHREPTQEQKIEVGRTFERLLNEDRESCADKVEAVLSQHCAEIERKKCRNEREVINLACLVEREAMGEFEKDVFEAATQFDHNFAFDFNGPWAPHNFVELDLKL